MAVASGIPALPPAVGASPGGAGDVTGGPVAAVAGAGVAPGASWLDIDGRYPQVQDSWTRPLDLPRNHQVAVSPDGQRAFAHTADGRVSAFDPATGDVQWTRESGELIWVPTASPDGAALITVTKGGVVRSLDSATGDPKWEAALSTGAAEAAVCAPDGSVLVRTFDHHLVRLDPKDGHRVYDVHPGAGMLRGPLVGRDGTAYVVDWESKIRALNPDGSERWAQTADTVASMVVGADGTLYVGAEWGKIRALDPRTGEETWAVLPVLGNSRENKRPVMTLVDDGSGHPTIYASCDSGFVFALDARDGHVEWSSQQSRYRRPRPEVMPDGTVVAPADSRHVYGLDPKDGSVLWQWTPENCLSPRPVVDAGGRLLCRDDDGSVRMAKPTLRFEQAARDALEASADADRAAGRVPGAPPPGIEVEDSWIVIGDVRVPRRT